MQDPLFTVKFKDGSALDTSDVYLKIVHNPEIGRIPLTSNNYLTLSKTLTIQDMGSLVSLSDTHNEDGSFNF